MGNGTLPIKTIERGNIVGNNNRPLGIDSIDSSIAAQDPLLPKCDNDERFNNSFFGQFKGFSITPLSRSTTTSSTSVSNTTDSTTAPTFTRPAPPPPVTTTWSNGPSIVPIKTNCMPPPQRISTMSQRSVTESESKIIPPTLPPPNVGSTARPLISNPVLSTTTCTNVDLKLPTRSAPDVPARLSVQQQQQQPKERPTSPEMLQTTDNERERGHTEKMTIGSNSTLTRIASMLYHGGKNDTNGSSRYSANSLPRNHHHHHHHHVKATKVLDKEILRKLKISAPIPQNEIEIPVAVIPIKPDNTSSQESSPTKRAKVTRTQSMRDTKLNARPAIHSFGSMRHPNGKRPTSIPASVRPTSPPPVPPTIKIVEAASSTNKIPGVPGYQNPSAIKKEMAESRETYEDCMNRSENSLNKIAEESLSTSLLQNNDNIYAVIEESVPEKKLKKSNVVANNVDDNEYKMPKKMPYR